MARRVLSECSEWMNSASIQTLVAGENVFKSEPLKSKGSHMVEVLAELIAIAKGEFRPTKMSQTKDTGRRVKSITEVTVGFDIIVVSEIEVPILLGNRLYRG